MSQMRCGCSISSSGHYASCPERSEVYQSQQTVGVLQEVFRMRMKQDAKWGEQNHPQHALPDETIGDEKDRALYYGIPTEAHAKAICDNLHKAGRSNWTHIHLEEFCEMVSAQTLEERRAELLDLAGTCIGEIEAIDRQTGKWPKEDPGGGPPTVRLSKER